MGLWKRISHRPGESVSRVTGMTGHWCLRARIAGSGVIDDSAPNSLVLSPARPEY